MELNNVILDPEDISEAEGRGLVGIARLAIDKYLREGKVIDLPEVPFESWKKLGASFVTLEDKETGALRGCIGSIIPVQPLYKDVIRNSIAAATQDPRFPPLSYEELPNTKVKVSILSYPKRLEFQNPQDLLNKIEPFKDGLILKYGSFQGTFLPDVWEDLPEKTLFLSHLCRKAGLQEDCWYTLPIEIYRYRTKIFTED